MEYTELAGKIHSSLLSLYNLPRSDWPVRRRELKQGLKPLLAELESMSLSPDEKANLIKLAEGCKQIYSADSEVVEAADRMTQIANKGKQGSASPAT